MADKQENVVLGFKMDGQVEYATTIKEINTVMNTAAKEFKQQVAAMGDNATATQKLTAQKQKLQIQLQGAEKRTRMLSAEYEEMKKSTDVSTEALNKQYGKVVASETAEAKLKTSLDRTNEELKKQGNVSVETAAKMEKIEKAGDKMQSIGKGMSTYVTAPIVAVGAASFKAFGEVDDALDGIISKTGATGKEASGLEESFNHVAGNGPFELNSVGDAIGSLHQQFGLTDKELETTSTKLLQYAEVNNTDVATATNNAKSNIEAYGLSNKDLSSVLDITTKAAHDSGVSVDDLTQQALKAAPAAKGMKLSYGETVTLLGKLQKGGVDSSKAMSYMSKAAVEYAKDGKSLSEGLAETQKKILGAKSSTEQLNIASEVFGTRGAVTMVDAIKRGKLNLSDLAKESKNAGGSVKNTFEATEDPVDKFKTALNNGKLVLSDLATTIQEMMAPALSKMVASIKGVVSWFKKLSPEQKEMVVKIGLIVAAIGPVILIIGKVMSSVHKMVKVVQDVRKVITLVNAAMAANPIGLIIAAVAALTAGLIWFFTQTKTGQKLMAGFVKWMQDAWSNIAKFFSDLWKGITDTFKNAIQAISDFVKPIWQGLVDFTKNLWNGIKSFFGTLWNGIKTVFTTVLNVIKAFIKAEFDGWKLIITTVMNAIKTVISAVWNGIKTAVTTVINAIKTVITTVFNAIKTVITNIWNGIKTVTNNVWNGIKSTISNLVNGIKSTVSNVFNGIKSTVTNIWNGIKSTTTRVWNGIKNAISSPMNAAKSLVKGVINSIKGFFNFRISWPHIPMPHFSISPAGWNVGQLLKGKIPHLGIDWRAEGAVFTKPTFAGMANGRIQGLGEAGPEAALPLNAKVLGQIGKSIASTMPGTGPIYLQVDGKTFGQLIGPYINNAMGNIQGATNMALGRR